MDELSRRANALQVRAQLAKKNIEGMTKSPLVKMLPGASVALPDMVAALNESAALLVAITEKLEALENGKS